MKTLLFTLEYPPFKGGVANYYENMVEHWPTEDGKNEIRVLHNNNGKLLFKKMFPKWIPAIFILIKTLTHKKMDHILVGHILPLGTVTYIVTRFMRKKYSVILHGMDFAFALKIPRKMKIAKKVLRNAEHIICANSYVAKMVTDTFGEVLGSKINVVNPGIKTELRCDLNITRSIKEKFNLENKTVMFSVGRLVERKGFDMVIKSMKTAIREVPELIYAIMGMGPDEERLKKIVAETEEIKNNVIFLNSASDEEKWAWMCACDIFIMPSRDIDGDFEGFGIVYLEANLAGKPVIAGDSGGVRDAVVHGETGLLVNPEEVQDIAGAILKLSKDKELRERYGEVGRVRATKEFNWEYLAEKIFKTIS